MKVLFDEDAWEDYQFWIENDRKLLKRINELVRDTSRSPFKGMGKPEPLRNELSGWWSRRITEQHRMVYRVTGSGADRQIEIIQLRFHY